ncbi:MAG: hypothetical protein JRI59_01720, partial [Deltaproteobacteria bacterium]|nr:hypothetical protein [Deltaproteobacteria bacterium]
MAVKDDRFFPGGQKAGASRTGWRLFASPVPDGVHVWVSHIDDEAAQDGLDILQLQAQVEWRLAAAGIPVRHQEESPDRPQAAPCLGVLLHLRRTAAAPSDYIFSVEVFFVRAIIQEDEPATRGLHLSWCQEALGSVPMTPQGPDWSAVFSHVHLLVEDFISSFQAAQP